MRPFPFRHAAALVLLFIAGDASAVCLFGPTHLRVGADAQHCQYNDIQSAINAADGSADCPTIIDITREHLYTNQHLNIDNKTRGVTLQGWGDGVTCAMIPGTRFDYSPPASTNPLVTLDGSNSTGSVLYVTGNTNLAIRNLTLTRGNNGGTGDNNAVGGGIHFDGQGSLTLTRSVVSFNNAAYGAGIDVSGSSGPVAFTLGSDSYVLSNTASVSGGGLRVRHDTRLYALQPNTFIAFNQAPNGYGGGLEVIGPARADIGSPGWGGTGVIYGNSAMYGGGMDILAFDGNADATVRLFSTDPAHPVRLQGNTASHAGGAVYMKGYKSALPIGTAYTYFCAWDFRIDDNVAQEGTAFYGDTDTDAFGETASAKFF
jgi:predicted outer membrane repeat protein